MTDTQRAMLGDREAGRRLADQGRLIPCQHGYEAMIVSSGGNWPQELYRVITRRHCCMQSTFYGSRRSAARAWNCRAQLLTPEQFGRLESGGEAAAFDREAGWAHNYTDEGMARDEKTAGKVQGCGGAVEGQEF